MAQNEIFALPSRGFSFWPGGFKGGTFQILEHGRSRRTFAPQWCIGRLSNIENRPAHRRWARLDEGRATSQTSETSGKSDAPDV